MSKPLLLAFRLGPARTAEHVAFTCGLVVTTSKTAHVAFTFAQLGFFVASRLGLLADFRVDSAKTSMARTDKQPGDRQRAGIVGPGILLTTFFLAALDRFSFHAGFRLGSTQISLAETAKQPASLWRAAISNPSS